MSASSPQSSEDNQTSARVLLEQYCYGHGPDVEAILRFARAHRLEDDNLVFLLVAILKVNEGIVHKLLMAIDGTERAINNAKEARSYLSSLTQKLIGQLEAAANFNAGHLNVAADRLKTTAAHAEQLCNHLLTASADLRGAQGVFERAAELSDGSGALDRLIDRIRAEARADLRGYHVEMIEELDRDVRRETWAIHAYGMVGLVGWIAFIVWAVVR